MTATWLTSFKEVKISQRGIFTLLSYIVAYMYRSKFGRYDIL